MFERWFSACRLLPLPSADLGWPSWPFLPPDRSARSRENLVGFFRSIYVYPVAIVDRCSHERSRVSRPKVRALRNVDFGVLPFPPDGRSRWSTFRFGRLRLVPKGVKRGLRTTGSRLISQKSRGPGELTCAVHRCSPGTWGFAGAFAPPHLRFI